MNSTIEATPTSTSPTATATASPDDPYQPHGSPVVAFLIGLCIILVSSILNAGGLNITKLDHIRTSALPKASQKKEYLRPLWVLGMVLYILSQLIGSTLALEYMRAEYVAPLGSTSLIFNFLFASLIGTPVSRMDIYGTVVVVLGVIGIVGFGSINSGLETEMDLNRLKTLWGRAGWLGYFFLMSSALIVVYIGASQLDQVLTARSELNVLPTSTTPSGRSTGRDNVGFFATNMVRWEQAMHFLREKLEVWTGARDDRYVAWTLGVGWSCIGGGLAGACLIFAKATVKMVSGTLSGRNEGNQFAHPASIFTIIFLATTAVTQIICLNRGLKVYDSTLVVPVFYGIYTASGFLNSLVFNNEVDSYQTWTLFCLGISIMVLILGVVLLTHEKPVNKPKPRATGDDDEDDIQISSVTARRRRVSGDPNSGDEGVVWGIGEDSDDEESDRKKAEATSKPRSATRTPSHSPSLNPRLSPIAKLRKIPSNLSLQSSKLGLSARGNLPESEEARGLIQAAHEDEEDEAAHIVDSVRDTHIKDNSSDSDDFGSWEDGSKDRPRG